MCPWVTMCPWVIMCSCVIMCSYVIMCSCVSMCSCVIMCSCGANHRGSRLCAGIDDTAVHRSMLCAGTFKLSVLKAIAGYESAASSPRATMTSEVLPVTPRWRRLLVTLSRHWGCKMGPLLA